MIPTFTPVPVMRAACQAAEPWSVATGLTAPAAGRRRTGRIEWTPLIAAIATRWSVATYASTVRAARFTTLAPALTRASSVGPVSGPSRSMVTAIAGSAGWPSITRSARSCRRSAVESPPVASCQSGARRTSSGRRCVDATAADPTAPPGAGSAPRAAPPASVDAPSQRQAASTTAERRCEGRDRPDIAPRVELRGRVRPDRPGAGDRPWWTMSAAARHDPVPMTPQLGPWIEEQGLVPVGVAPRSSSTLAAS